MASPKSIRQGKVNGVKTTPSTPHADRTAAEPLEHDMHEVTLDKIDRLTANIRVLPLRRVDGDQ